MHPPSSQSAFDDVRMRGFAVRTDVADAQEIIRRRIGPLGPTRVPLSDCAGRVLAVDVVARCHVPHFDRSAMDGYALIAEETFGADTYNPMPFRVIGQSTPGRGYAGCVTAGTCVRILTGAPIPQGASAVIPVELTRMADGHINVVEPLPPGKNVGRIGEDVRSGDRVLSAGRLLRPQDAGILSSIGVADVDVVSAPRVRIVITGDELLPPGSVPEGARIVDSNSVILRSLVKRDGGIIGTVDQIPDQPEALRACLRDSDWDVMLVSGGTSVGAEDHAPSVIAEMGELPIHGVSLRPAAPTGIGFVRGRPVFLLPGNPVSCLCAYDLFAGPVIRRCGGRSESLPYPIRRAELATKLVSAVGRTDYVRVRIGPQGVEPIAISGASALRSTVIADGFVIVPPLLEGYPPGASVDVFLYDSAP